MGARVSRRLNLDGVPNDRDAVILVGEVRPDGLAIRITHRRGHETNLPEDRIAFERCPAEPQAALALATDLAFLLRCESVFVICKGLPVRAPQKPERLRTANDPKSDEG